MSQTLNSKIAVIGIDIGKNSFHVVGQDRRGALVLRQNEQQASRCARQVRKTQLATGPKGAIFPDGDDPSQTVWSNYEPAVLQCSIQEINTAQRKRLIVGAV
jgi:hypothetical protein